MTKPTPPENTGYCRQGAARHAPQRGHEALPQPPSCPAHRLRSQARCAVRRSRSLAYQSQREGIRRTFRKTFARALSSECVNRAKLGSILSCSRRPSVGHFEKRRQGAPDRSVRVQSSAARAGIPAPRGGTVIRRHTDATPAATGGPLNGFATTLEGTVPLRANSTHRCNRSGTCDPRDRACSCRCDRACLCRWAAPSRPGPPIARGRDPSGV
jgi:hypothetical protein